MKKKANIPLKRILALTALIVCAAEALFAQTTGNLNDIANALRTIDTNDIANAARIVTNALENPEMIEVEMPQGDLSALIRFVNLADEQDLREYAKLRNIELPKDANVDAIRKTILAFIREPKKRVAYVADLVAIERSTKSTGSADVLLERANIVERYTTANEEIIRLYGNVNLRVYDFVISADTIIYSVTTGEVFGEGNVTVQNASMRVEGDWFSLNRFDKTGVLHKGISKMPDQNMNVYGHTIKFRDSRFFATQGYLTTSSFADPAYFFLVDTMYLWDERKIMALNMRYRIGDQSFFWFPIFVQNYFDIREHIPFFKYFDFTFGNTLKEGYFIQAMFHPLHFLGLSHAFRFDAYQKLGFFAGDTITFKGDWGEFDLNLMGALSRGLYDYSPSTSFTYANGSRRYINYLPPEMESLWTFRWKYSFNGTLQIYKRDFDQAEIKWKYSDFSDLYFQGDFEGQKDKFDFNKFINSGILQTVESLQEQSAETGYDRSLAFNSRGEQYSLGATMNTSFYNIRNISAENNFSNNQYLPIMQQYTLPRFSFDYNGTLDPKTSSNDAALNLVYKFGVAFNHVVTHATYSSLELTTNANIDEATVQSNLDKVKEVESDRSTITMNANVSRSFRAGEFFTITPKAGVDYSSQYSAISTIAQKQSERANTFTKLIGENSMSLSLPQSIFSEKAKNYFLLSASLSSAYALAYKLEPSDGYLVTEQYGGFDTHWLSGSANVAFTGYGFLFIKGVDLILRGSANARYNLRPSYNSEDERYRFGPVWDTNRIENIPISGSIGLEFFKFATVNYSVGRNFLQTNLTSHRANAQIKTDASLKDYILLFAPAIRDLFYNLDGKDFDVRVRLNTAWNQDLLTYRTSSITFGAGFSIQLSDRNGKSLWDISFGVESLNSSPYRYFKKFAESEGVEHLNFFTDLLDSFRFDDYERRARSLFKLGGLKAALTHELDGWVMQIAYAMERQNLPTSGSVKGYYIDNRITLSMKMLEFDVIQFPEQEVNFSDEKVKQFIE